MTAITDLNHSTSTCFCCHFLNRKQKLLSLLSSLCFFFVKKIGSEKNESQQTSRRKVNLWFFCVSLFSVPREIDFLRNRCRMEKGWKRERRQVIWSRRILS